MTKEEGEIEIDGASFSTGEAYFGRLNEIYFALSKGRICSVADRGRRTPSVAFLEQFRQQSGTELEERLSLTSHSLVGILDATPRGGDSATVERVERAGRIYDVRGTGLQHIEQGGRILRYDTIQFTSEKTVALLTISMPAGSRLSVSCPSLTGDESSFALGPQLRLEVHATSGWAACDGVIEFDCSADEGEIAFRFESFGLPHPIARSAIIAVPGREHDAILARAAFGRDFVPCFVLPHIRLWQRMLDSSAFDTVLLIGPNADRGHPEREINFESPIGGSAQVRERIGCPIRPLKVVVPANDHLLGPALFIAIIYSAELEVDPATDKIVLSNNGEVIRTWSRAEVLGLEIPLLNEVVDASHAYQSDELVVCETSLQHLLVAQAVGYATSHRLPIAFIESTSIDPGEAESVTFEEFRARAERLVPESMRRPNYNALTIFTEQFPLHLVRTSAGASWPRGYWATEYVVSHLPGQTASVLIPRWFGDQLERAADVPLTLFFNALGNQAHEREELGRAISSELSNVIQFEGMAAQSDVLSEVLHRCPSELLLIAAHGVDDSIELADGRRIRASEISDWVLSGSPIVFNNSCNSWAGVGTAFLRAGARAYVGTLWGVGHHVAGQAGSRFLQHLRNQKLKTVASALQSTLGDLSNFDHGETSDYASYIYVGLPQTTARMEPALNRFERLETASVALHRLYAMLHRLVEDARAPVALLMRQSIHDAVAAGFSGISELGEAPLPLPPPLAGTILDLDFVLGTADLHILQHIGQVLPPERQEPILKEAIEVLDTVVDELATWKDRHSKFQRPPDTFSSEFAFAGDGPSEFMIYRLMAQTVLNLVLPIAADCAAIHLIEDAMRLIALASIMVTIQEDLQAGFPPQPEIVRNRIRRGVPLPVKVYGGTEETLEIDMLGNSVDRSDLANRFGIAFRRIGDEFNAIAFFELAESLAPAGSNNLRNAAANRSRLASPLIDLPEIFVQQFAAGDYANACVTGSNLLRYAGQKKASLADEIVQQICTSPTHLYTTEERIGAECEMLGSLAVYRASQGRIDDAVACTERICQSITSGVFAKGGGLARATVSARSLLEYFAERKIFRLAFEQGERVCTYLSRAELFDEQARTHLALCSIALDAYQCTGTERFIERFLEHSSSAGALLKDRPEAGVDLEVWLGPIFRNTVGVWQQSDASGNLNLAVMAYDAQRRWRDGTTQAQWEMLRAARSQDNIKAVKELAASGDLFRSARVLIDSELRVSASISTHRSSRPVPKAVLSLWPFAPTSEMPAEPGQGVSIAARHGVMILKAGETATIWEHDLPHFRRDTRGACLYSDVWGSDSIVYTLEIEMPRRLLPQHIDFEGIDRRRMALDIRFYEHGSQLRISSRDPEKSEPWRARMNLFCFDIGLARLPFTESGSPFCEWIPFELFEHMMNLVGKPNAES
ncbi:CHAT domain-containing protein [Rhizobium ruizarguesonis]|uniref:CHAT domain-containing protein n=1 Tax=Rhizobium ruizarguesonis TaxID=2081791 RepID=UPI001030CD8B|nr:CHAT domain-containing protein [Rhizobium ruizarguesonis]TAU35388.1 CHAT domain-containing protein [Rhizobium ruizarguesonis]TAU45872.1 CHAT domain-containing protein [Rhizobium ruizarguesonis]